MKRVKVGIIFGGRSVEHEVSIISSYQVIEAIDREKFEPIPIYITKEGKWITGKSLFSISSFKRAFPNVKGEEAFISPIKDDGFFKKGLFLKRLPLDIVFPLIHGTYGEDGTLQGLLEMANIPYVGSGVLGSSLCMDKIASKRIFKSMGFSVVDWLFFEKELWKGDKEKVIKEIEERLSFPVIVKPSNLGSSIGINICQDRDGLEAWLDVCFEYSQASIVERALSGFREINCAILGDAYNATPSLVEEVMRADKFLTYEEKYRKGKGMGATSRVVPAEIGEEIRLKIQGMAIEAFKAFNLSGVCRIDFLLKDDSIFINEINTIPGSLSFYLFEPLGISFKELITRLISLGFDNFRRKKETKYYYKIGIFGGV